jgi:hypothetical protein
MNTEIFLTAIVAVDTVAALTAGGIGLLHWRRAQRNYAVAESWRKRAKRNQDAFDLESVEAEYLRGRLETVEKQLAETRDAAGKWAARSMTVAREMARHADEHKAEREKLIADRTYWRKRCMSALAILGNKSDKRKKAEPPLSLVA